ncbi:hypothetical protein K491DRAFT_703574 [Lophiostoma macrostomum CBS 122681]|uniref:Uncharacterized protein n=1 Tax=Lophiostoma macrostomum CBS 122681 TaxID=1314788 RepID=A0A6A6TD37_9PLEO|nr:hypothetical protein K491DRAFT_703574 [Lophiostoma macrostomum CBS 122681]
MGNWFGNLQLAYKYTIVFVSLLVLTIAAGLAKVLYNRRKMKQYKKEESVEVGARDDQVELNQREKDEGDLFGVRAIEAGFYAGIPQSRPTSRAGSIAGSPSMSTSTLVGGFNSPKVATHSMASSVTTLPLAHMNSTNRDSETLPSNSPPRNKRSPPTIKLRPSEAELSGRLNHNTAVNMNLNVPPSPILARGPQSPTFGGSDSGDDDGQTSPRSLSPNYRPDHYAPIPPRLPMPEGLRATVHEAEETSRSQAGSVNDPSPGPSAPPSPGHPPQSKLPSMPHSLFPGNGSGFEPSR